MLRRSLLLGSLLLAGSRLAGAAGTPGPIRFTVLRGDEPIGTHVVSFTERGGKVEVDIAIDLEVKVLFVTAFTYRHRNREVWAGDQLESIATETNNDGTKLFVEGRLEADGFHVANQDGKFVAPRDIWPSSWWDKRFMDRGEWLDTQHGGLLKASVAELGVEAVEVGGKENDATHYRLRGGVDLDIWYAGEDWVKLTFAAPSDGSLIVYRREPAGA